MVEFPVLLVDGVVEGDHDHLHHNYLLSNILIIYSSYFPFSNQVNTGQCLLLHIISYIIQLFGVSNYSHYKNNVLNCPQEPKYI